MSTYQVLARKLRPTVFSELIGQEHVATTLTNALKSDRMPHALLFTGARGVGKTSAARILAKSLRCPNVVDFVPCGKCDDCEEIAAGRSVNVIEIDGASNNGVESIRELRETVGYMPSHGKYKVYIIDEVHMLTTSAFNALLKTLEEPPAHVVFIFATTEPQKIPVTILSRVQRFDFRRIPARKIFDRLKTISESEGVKAEPQALWLIARESEGSMRDSQSLLDQVITFCGEAITHKQVVEVLGLTDRTLLSDTLKALIDRNAQAGLDIIQKVFDQGYDPKQFAQDVLEHLRNLMIVKVSGGASNLEFLDLPDQEIDELKKFAQNLSEDDVHLLFDMTLKGVSDVVRAQDPRIVLDMLVLRLTQAPRLEAIENIIAAASSGSGNQDSKVSREQVVRPQAQSTTPRVGYKTEEPVVNTPVVNVQTLNPDLAQRWAAFVEQAKIEKPLLGAKLAYARCTEISGDVVSISFKKEQEFFFDQLSQKEALDQLNLLFEKLWGIKAKAKVLLDTGVTSSLSPKEMHDSESAAQKKQARLEMEAHPVVSELKKSFNAQVTGFKELT